MPPCVKMPAAPRPLDLSLAFPSALRPAAAALSRGWNPDEPLFSYTVMFEREALIIPSRVYFQQGVLWNIGGDRAPLERDIAWCLGTRHHSGYVREECLRRLLAAPQPWMVPFIVQLIGEYVVQIVEPIADALPAMAPEMQDAFAGFIRANPRYLQTIDSRAVNYWSIGYRTAYPDRADYPGIRAVAYLRALAAQTSNSSATRP